MSGQGAVRPDDALELLYFAFREVVLEPDRVLARRGLGRVHHRVLFMCRRGGDLSLGELMRVLDVSKQALHRPLRELAEAGLLVAEADATDRRTRRLRLTAAGRALEESLSGMQRAAFARAFATVGEPGAEAWARVMAALGDGKTAAALRAAPPEPGPETGTESGPGAERPPSSRSRGRIEPPGRRRGAT